MPQTHDNSAQQHKHNSSSKHDSYARMRCAGSPLLQCSDWTRPRRFEATAEACGLDHACGRVRPASNSGLHSDKHRWLAHRLACLAPAAAHTAAGAAEVCTAAVPGRNRRHAQPDRTGLGSRRNVADTQSRCRSQAAAWGRTPGFQAAVVRSWAGHKSHRPVQSSLCQATASC